MAFIQQQDSAPANNNGFKKADLFGNPEAIVTKSGVEIPVYASKGASFFIGQQRDPQALAVLQQIEDKREAGEDVVLTMKIIFRGKKAEVHADTTISLDDL